MSCFGGAPATTGGAYCRSASGRSGGRRPWRWWRAKCAGIAAAIGSRIRRSIRVIDGRRRRRRATSSSSFVHVQSDRCHHHRRSFAPVYVDELYSQHHHQPAKAALRVVRAEEPPRAGDGNAKPAAAAPVSHAARAAGGKPTARVGAADASGAPARAGAAPRGARASGGKQQAAMRGGAAAAAGGGVGGAMRSVLLRSPGRGGGGGVLGAVKGMGEVDLRAELFIRRFKEDMRLQSQRSAEEFQAMLARGL